MFCTKCGALLEDGSSFCTACGTPVEGCSGDVSHAEPTEVTKRVSDPTVHPDQAQAQAQAQASKRAPIIIAIVAIIVIVVIGCGVWLLVSKDTPDQGKTQSQMQSQLSGQDAPAASAANSAQSEESANEISSSNDSNAGADDGSINVAVPQKKGFEGITSVSASSYLPVDAINNRGYTAANAIDGNAQLAWVEGASGSGIGEWIAFKGNGEQGFSGFNIWNGYQESDDIYRKNARPSSVSVYVDGEKIGWYQLQDSGLGSQRVDFGDTFEGTEIKLVIDSVYPGWKYEDCGISEISFF